MKIYLLLILVAQTMSQISIGIEMKDHNFTIAQNNTVNQQFLNSSSETCQSRIPFIENYNITERTFYVNNTGLIALQVIFGDDVVDVPNNTTTKHTLIYENCSDASWQQIEIVFGDTIVTYIKLCQPLSLPLHPLLLLLATAFVIVYVGSIYGQEHVVMFGEEQNEQLGMKQAMGFVFVGSFALMTIYYFMAIMQILLLVWMTCVGLYSLYRLSNDILRKVFKCFERSIRLIYFGKVTYNRVLSLLISIPIIISYLVTRHWLVSNIVAISITLMMFQLIEIDSLRTGTVLLCLAFLYDIFWVFLSSYFFGQSVMATVATMIDLPMKLQCPILFGSALLPFTKCSLLGLGDIILPGIIIKYLYQFNRSTFLTAYIGYIGGLCTCMYFVVVYQLAQPALLYIVPAMLVPALISARYQKQFHKIWVGQVFKKKIENIQSIEQIDQDYELTAGEI